MTSHRLFPPSLNAEASNPFPFLFWLILFAALACRLLDKSLLHRRGQLIFTTWIVFGKISHLIDKTLSNMGNRGRSPPKERLMMNVCLIGNIVIRLLNPGFVPGASYLTWEATLTMRCFDYSMFFLGQPSPFWFHGRTNLAHIPKDCHS